MHTLKNDKLEICVKKIGAELCKIASIKNKTDFMWDADPDVWENYAPNLFPIIGALKENTYIFENKAYKLPKHGFIRYNEDMTLHEKTGNSLTFKLVSNENTLNVYPFQFEFYITYTLTDNNIAVKHTIKNKDSKTLYFSVGGHPAFKCPVYNGETYDDYFLEFEAQENAKRHLINMENGLISSKTESVFNNSNTLNLQHRLFNADALVFKDMTSRRVSLKSRKKGTILDVSYDGFPYLGIWAKPNGNYVCIEPWMGIADSETTNQNLKDKEGILSLAANNTFEATYNIEIHNSHLV